MDAFEERLRLDALEKPSNCDAFLAELSELSAKHGIAIGGDAVLFVMEREDFSYAYHVDDESKLTLG
jgi:hypothetical protein